VTMFREKKATQFMAINERRKEKKGNNNNT
jgi:hypothetical protein